MTRTSHALVLAALLAATATVSANAATVLLENSISAGETFTQTSVIIPGDEVEFRFTVLETLSIDSFALAATGNNSGADIDNIRFGFMMPVNGEFTTIEVDGTSESGLGFLPGRIFEIGEMFSIFFDDGIIDEVGVSVSFRTDVVDTPAPIPLPATGLLLAPLLLAGGFAGLRRRRSNIATA